MLDDGGQCQGRTPNGLFTSNKKNMLRSILLLKKTKAVDLIGRVGKLVDVVVQGTVLSLEGEIRVSGLVFGVGIRFPRGFKT